MFRGGPDCVLPVRSVPPRESGDLTTLEAHASSSFLCYGASVHLPFDRRRPRSLGPTSDDLAVAVGRPWGRNYAVLPIKARTDAFIEGFLQCY